MARRKTKAPARRPKSKKANGHDTLRDVEQLLYRQAECLDGKRWQEFIDSSPGSPVATKLKRVGPPIDPAEPRKEIDP